MALDQKIITPEDKKKLSDTEAAALRIYQEIDDLKGGLKETIKVVAEELGVKPAVLTKIFRSIYRNKIADDKEQSDDAQELLHVLGHV